MLRFPLLAICLLALAIVSSEASAECKRLGFSVNDYGKDGPARDAKRLLDDYMKRWAAERGIRKYRVGNNTVTCELFLDFGFFDEHTCKASATFCWSEADVASKN